MSYPGALSDLRLLLADTDKSKCATRKRLVGNVDGDNAIFTTFDKNLYEDTVVVYVNDEVVNFTVDDSVRGTLTLAVAPDENTKVNADYYFQWWRDVELTGYLNRGAQSCSIFDPATPEASYLLVPQGLRDAVLYFAASDANRAQVQYMIMRRHSEEFLIQQDGNDDDNYSKMISSLQKQADWYFNNAVKIRDDFYERQGRRNAPAFNIKTVGRKQYGPNR